MQKRRLKKLIGTVQTDSSASSEDLELKLKDLQRMAEEQIDPEACTILVCSYTNKVVISRSYVFSTCVVGRVPVWN